MSAARRLTYFAVVAMSAASRLAAADRYEASVTLRPIGGVSRVTEDVGGNDGATSTAPRATGATTYSAGGELELAYGLRNWLDVSAELVASGCTEASYDQARVSVMGAPATGHLVRTTRLAQLRAGATLRAGVAWVSTLHLGLGVGGRASSAATLAGATQGRMFETTPDGMSSGVSMDGAVVARVGLEHRLGARWGIGVAAEATHTTGFGAAPIDTASAGISLSYTWYPLLPW